MKTRYFYLMAALALMAGCAKESLEPQNELSGEKFYLTVGLPSDSKTHMGDSEAGARPVYWSNGDQIAVNGTASEELADLPEGTTSTTFTFDGVLSTPYNVLYPASIYEDATHVTLPAVQTYKSGGFAEGMNPMAGYTDGSNIQLSHLCAIVKISVKQASGEGADTDNLVSVRFKGRNDEQVSGTFSINYVGATLTGTSSEAADKEVKVVKSQATSTTSAAVYYIVVPAGTYSNGFDVIVMDKNGHFMTKSKNSSKTLAAGHLYNMPEFEFDPSGTELGVEIASAEDLIQFATDYNNKVYADLGDEPLIATVTQDITFDATSSAAFNATGGIGNKIGDETNYFNGIFNGDNHTISGLIATVPIFAYTGGGGNVMNLTLSSSCSYTVDSPASLAFHGALVGRNKGIVKDCTNNGSFIINNIQDVSTSSQYYGGLVGYNPEGIVDGCTMAGNITCSQTSISITANYPAIGGVVGYQGDNGGTINNCTYTGNITISDGTTYGGITATKLYFYIGGILGRAEKAVITNCTAGINGTARSIDVRGKFVPGIGGIIGWEANAADSQISGCNNFMSLSFTSDGLRANTTPCRIGGIASRSAVEISDCENYGAISSACNSTTLYLGGIVADGANVSNCTNYASGTIIRSNADLSDDQANRYLYIGGIMGASNASCDIKDCTNKAAVTCNAVGTASATTVDMGGILGAAVQQVDLSDCANEAEVKFDNDNASAVKTTRNAIGGIVGNVATAATTAIGCANSGKVWINNNTAGSYGMMFIGGIFGHTSASSAVTDCTNSGEILCQNPGAAITAYVDLGGIVGCAEATITIKGTTADATLNSGPVTVAQASSAILYARNTQGGILGYGKGDDTKITNCKNTSQIYCNLTGVTANNRPSYTGGIVGILANLTYAQDAANKLAALTGVEIGNCVNTGKVNSSNYNNRAGNKAAPFAGGIAGLVCGTSASLASIHDCTVGNQQVYMYRGASGGGIIGYANYCNIEDCTSSADMSGMNASVNGVGGIAGRMFDSEMSRCTFSGKIAKAKNIGGLVYTLSEQQSGSSISNCNVNGATLSTGTASDKTAAAVLVSITDNKVNTITDCGVKGTLDNVAISLSSNMITTDGGATVSGTYLLP